MRIKGFILLITSFIFISCAPIIGLKGNISDTKNGIVLYHQSYTRADYTAPNGFDWIVTQFVIINNSEKDVLIDLDELSLIDDDGNLNRVESVQGKKHNDDGEILLTIKGKTNLKKKISFIIQKNKSIKGFKYKDSIENL